MPCSATARNRNKLTVMYDKHQGRQRKEFRDRTVQDHSTM